MITIKNTCWITIICLIGLSNADAGNWIKDPATECSVWNPNPQKYEIITWCGNIKEGKANGYGVAIWSIRGKTTERAEGEWKNGRLHGSAVWSQPKGAQYSGEWKNGEKSGYGIYIWPNGTIFMGEYSHDQRKLGKLIDADGNQKEIIQTSLIRKISYKAQDAAITARKAATRAKLENKKCSSQVKLTKIELKRPTKDSKRETAQKTELIDTPITEEDPSAK